MNARSITSSPTEALNEPQIQKQDARTQTVQDITCLTKCLIVTGKVLLVAVVITTLVAICLTTPMIILFGPASAVFGIGGLALMSLGALWPISWSITNTLYGLADRVCHYSEGNTDTMKLSNLFRYTGHDLDDVGYFILSSFFPCAFSYRPDDMTHSEFINAPRV